MNELVRDFKGVWIPKDIWLDERLSALDKIILIEIDSLDTTEEGCYASNEYLSEFCQCTSTKISTTINKLIKLEYIEVIKFDGRRRYIKSRLLKNLRQPLNFLKADFKKNKDININNNIDNNNNNIYIKHGKYKRIKLTEEQYNKLINEFGENYINLMIEKLDEYIESNNNKNKYTNFNLVLRKAIRENWFKIEKIPSWYKNEKKEEINDEQRAKIEAIRNGTYRA